MSTHHYAEDKLRELVLYVGAKCGLDPHYGVLKLNKILFYSDFRAYRTLGSPITGAVYKKYDHGPAPRGMKMVRERLIDAGEAFEYVNPLPYLADDSDDQRREKRLLPKATPNMSKFSPQETAIIDSVIEWLRPMTGTDVSKMSHRHPGWDQAEMNEIIPYCAELLVGNASPSQKDLAWATTIADKYKCGEIHA
jgi:hypothetical protein